MSSVERVNIRLLHTTRLAFQDFWDDPSTIRYAVLSHRWGEDEVSLQDFEARLRSGNYSLGMAKILKCCELADNRGFRLLWVDTCCIDKTNNTELSEAINSMWNWYANSWECFVYLSDVSRIRRDHDMSHFIGFRNNILSTVSFSMFRQSSWFTRGWTLQELLAPRNVTFCDTDWNIFGTKLGLSFELSQITGIRQRYLRGTEPLLTASIAMRMSWASNRSTTKKEDMAYCLLGLFDVNMPLLYGEGEKAFMRLQLEIIKKSPDESIFAWKYDVTTQVFSPLAPSTSRVCLHLVPRPSPTLELSLASMWMGFRDFLIV